MKNLNFLITGFAKSVCILFLVFGFTACGQHKNIQIPLAKNSYPYSGCEPSIDINPFNNQHMAVGSILDGYHYSKDGGLTSLEKPLLKICLPVFFQSSALANETLHQSDRLALLKRREELFRALLELSQRQFAEKETREWDWLLERKQECIDELVQLDQLENQWTELHALEFSTEELQIVENLESLLKRIRESEEAFETNMNHEKQLLSKEMNQLRQQVNYSAGMKNTAPGRTKKVF